MSTFHNNNPYHTMYAGLNYHLLLNLVISNLIDNKTDHHDIAEILLKVTLNTINLTNQILLNHFHR